MSHTTSAPRWGVRTCLAGLVACALLAFAAIGLTAKAQADFTIAKCGGADILGRGASFARDAHTQFNTAFKLAYCPPGSIDVAYDPAGSGGGRLAVKVRNDTPRFGMTDDPPSAAEIEQINAGTGNNAPNTDTIATDNGKIHVIPAAVGAVAPLVNFPNGCDAGLLNDPYRTVTKQELIDFPNRKALLRVRFTKEQFEKVWAQGDVAGTPSAPYVNWDDVFPELIGDPECDVPVIRVVRFDESGTTFAFKDYLRTIAPGRGWTTKYSKDIATILTREWPGAEYGTGGFCGTTAGPGKLADSADHLTSGCGSGNQFLVPRLVEVDGSVGYSDIATARNNSTSLAITTTSGTTQPDKYWTQVQNGTIAVGSAAETQGQGFTEPTSNPEGFRNDKPRGANCTTTTFLNVPATTFGNWSPVTGVNSTSGFGICTLTYGLVFDDNAAVWGTGGSEQAQARTVKDYWETIVGVGQGATLTGADYAPLPADILAISKAGVSSISWNKSGAGAGGGGGGGAAGGGGSAGGGGGGAVVVPSNKFSVLRTTISSAKGTATFSVKLPGAGKLEVVGSAKNKGKKVNAGRVLLTVSKTGTYSVTLKPTGKAKSLLNEKGSLKVSLKFTFTPTGGTAGTSNSSVKLKLTKQSG